MSILWQCRHVQLYSTVALPSCCVSFLSNSAFTQLLLTFLPPLLLCPPTTRPVGGGACISWSGQAKLDDPGPHDPLSLIIGGHVALNKINFVREEKGR